MAVTIGARRAGATPAPRHRDRRVRAAEAPTVAAMRVREESGSFLHEDRRLAYRIYGEGPRVTVLLHGLLLSQRMHEPLARALAERGNRIVTLDLRGHGSSG